MNAENHFYSAEVYLEMARDKFTAHDYDSTLASLVKSYSHTRWLIEHVWKLKRKATLASRPAGEDTS